MAWMMAKKLRPCEPPEVAVVSLGPMDRSTAVGAWLESAQTERTPVSDSCFFGRAASCEVVLPDAKVSRQHALIQGQEHGEFWLIDLGSANGTYLNGRRVAQPCRLNDGDKLAIAGFSFTFRRSRPSVEARQDSTSTDATVHEIRSLTCWLLVADIEGSTQLLRRLPPEEAHRATGMWLAACSRILNEHHGVINKFLGDGFFAYWPSGEANAAAVAKALEALRSLQQTDSPAFRVVLHYGKVSAGGQASLGEESLAGNEVNFVFRVEKVAAGLGLSRLMSEPARETIKHLLPTIPEGEHAVPGFAGQPRFYSF